MQYRKLWITLIVVVVASFTVLGVAGYKGIKSAPPIPTKVVTTDGTVLFTGEQIQNGQNVWQSLGGQEIGSIWGHGAYVAPDWTADYLHRELTLTLDRQAGGSFTALPVGEQASLRAELEEATRRNTYDPATGTITVTPERAAAFDQLTSHYASVFGEGRTEYAIPRGTMTDATKMREMVAFFWWTAWSSSTNRPNNTVTYTQNWPPEDLISNRPSTAAIMWSIASVILLLAGIGALVWFYAANRDEEDHGNDDMPTSDPLLGATSTPSQRATIKYFLTAAALWILQLGMGGLVAHYGVEGSAFFGIPIDQILPYSIARTWHLQLGIFWIATSWLATGLYIVPAIAGKEPKGQRLGVNILFGAVVLVVLGSMTGEWLGIKQKLGNLWFWFGSQGYEYVDLGRVWQIALFGGLCFWLWLMWRGIRPALARRDSSRSLLMLFTVSAVAIPMFYGAGLMYGQRSHVAVAEYWRWWVVHLWVEGFFEVFATVVIAFLFTRLGLLKIERATKAVLFATIIFLGGGILGTFHHLYFTGMPNSILALGAVFSALEIVPLCLVGFEAWENLKLSRGTPQARWVPAYKWPIYFFIAVAFWNLVGAGLFGFLINPPVALYYVQGMNLTPLHGHTALFGVYGMLGLGLTLFCFRAMRPGLVWRERPIGLAFWFINIGLALMALLSLLPIGILQAIAAVDHGVWYARSAEFLQTPLMQNLRWLRAIGDTIFSIGALILAWFVVGLLTGWSFDYSAKRTTDTPDGVTESSY
ncbi:MAG: nitric-oxide reductase large subunit [Thermoanaerobaculia bacterium]